MEKDLQILDEQLGINTTTTTTTTTTASTETQPVQRQTMYSTPSNTTIYPSHTTSNSPNHQAFSQHSNDTEVIQSSSTQVSFTNAIIQTNNSTMNETIRMALERLYRLYTASKVESQKE